MTRDQRMHVGMLIDAPAHTSPPTLGGGCIGAVSVGRANSVSALSQRSRSNRGIDRVRLPFAARPAERVLSWLRQFGRPGFVALFGFLEQRFKYGLCVSPGVRTADTEPSSRSFQMTRFVYSLAKVTASWLIGSVGAIHFIWTTSGSQSAEDTFMYSRESAPAAVFFWAGLLSECLCSPRLLLCHFFLRRWFPRRRAHHSVPRTPSLFVDHQTMTVGSRGVTRHVTRIAARFIIDFLRYRLLIGFFLPACGAARPSFGLDPVRVRSRGFGPWSD